MSKKASIITLVIIIILCAAFGYLGFAGMPFGRYDFQPFSKSINLGLDLKGGVYAVYKAQDESQPNLAENMDDVIAVMRNRLDQSGFTEATLSKQNNGTRVRVEIPNVSDPNAVFDLIGKPAVLKFVDPSGKVVMTGDHIKSAQPGIYEGGNVVNFTLDAEGTRIFGDATSKLVGQPLSIVLDGKEVSAPVVNTAITGGSGYIEGSFTQGSVQQLATQLRSGALKIPIVQSEASTVSATLGINALKTSIIAGIIGMILVMIFMIAFYRLPGLLADISLLVHTLLLLYILALFGIQLTLPGVAGIILGVGMSVDANVIIFARIRDELVSGKTLRSAVDGGFKKAFVTIFDSNITNLLAGIVLMLLGTGSIKGFAYTMILGVILTMITAVTLTRFLMDFMIRANVTAPWLYSHRWSKEGANAL